MMRIAVYEPQQLKAFSLLSYTQNIKQQLSGMGVEFISFNRGQRLPVGVDLYWDPRAAGGGAPVRTLQNARKPVVVTLHGASPFSLPAHELHRNVLKRIRTRIRNESMKRRWNRTDKHHTVITVSHYAKQEIVDHLPIPADRVVVIYHGLDHDLFSVSPGIDDVTPYLLSVSQYQAKKNLDRVFEAYQMFVMPDKPRLIAVAPNYPETAPITGIDVFREPLPRSKLARLYQHAFGFIFPSLHESFGFPITEAMACGCPVITSNTTACAEIGGDAALLVDPRSVQDIASAMQRLIEDAVLRASLRDKGIERAAHFTWDNAARQHLQVFENVLNGDPPLQGAKSA